MPILPIIDANVVVTLIAEIGTAIVPAFLAPMRGASVLRPDSATGYGFRRVAPPASA
jgi:hypothetical protein